ncbi:MULTISPECIES: hypothetical protein [unclassified Pseudovibrio]|uniref:hypothetical protein n=1 Tax=unclassified Pseudovibrio TaxID=2627060 RepID=UPI0007AE8A8E|nr:MULTISPECIES: hypothetical protein [unclassified Pseudovibrio]KZK94835.1 hypothetical protein PsW74_04347 [Pseudovibrio sp. W74]KZL08580.1 hypothetical protein PsAD14_02900 [Pseudovibrio sp. Ad14]
MLSNQLNISRLADQEAGQVDLSVLTSEQKLEGLTFALRGNERFWSSVVALARDVLFEQEGQLRQIECGANTIVAINATADRVSKRLKEQGCGLTVNGLPSIQRITHADAYT